jgi:hypothetical protein
MKRTWLVIALVVLLVGVGVWASAQVRGIDGGRDGLNLVAPTVFTGSDLGFRVESTKNGIALGTLVVRINGHWTDAQVGSNGVIMTSAVR